MDVCVLSTLVGDGWGGSEQLWSQAAGRLAEDGSRVTAITHARRTPPRALRELEARGVELRSWRTAGRVQRALLKAGVPPRPHVDALVLLVNMASAHDLIGATVPRSIVRRAHSARIPYVLAPHSLIERRLAPHNRTLLRRLYSDAASIVLPSARLRADLERQLVVSLPQCVEIPTGTELLSRAERPTFSTIELRLACVARIDVEQKGHDVLLSALASPRWRDREWSLDLYGTGPDEGYVRDLIGFYGLESRVAVRGVSHDIAGVWREHDVLVLPSRREARGIAITEAMAAGRPAVATAVGGIPDSVVDGVTGLLVTAPTHDAWAHGLERLWSNRDQLATWGAAARAHVERMFSEDPVDRLVSLLRTQQPPR